MEKSRGGGEKNGPERGGLIAKGAGWGSRGSSLARAAPSGGSRRGTAAWPHGDGTSPRAQ
jgi:hypothetical protein